MKPLIVIPARGGSKGVPGKNIKPLNGKPLIYHTIEAARVAYNDNQICVSTDDLEIKEVVEKAGLHVPFLRPSKLANDHAGMREVLLHALAYYEDRGYNADVIILLQPTSPFRKAKDIQSAIALFDQECDMVVSVKETKSNPYYVLKEEDNEGWLKSSKQGDFARRQDCPKVYELNGALYIIDVKALKIKEISKFTKVRKYIMSELNSIDIDTEHDWAMAEFFYEKYINEG
jgi:CMP-N,N'-diacetyllegionaminic acid synthase